VLVPNLTALRSQAFVVYSFISPIGLVIPSRDTLQDFCRDFRLEGLVLDTAFAL
jgi:hypothetical protein